MRRFINGLVARMRPEIREIPLGTAILNLSIIEMGTGKVASLHAWPYHTLRYELGGGKQLVDNRIQCATEGRVLRSYMTAGGYWRMGFRNPSGMTAHWNMGSNSYVLQCFPDAELCHMHGDAGFPLAARGVHNGGSHNHNYVGSFILCLNSTPGFIDPGAGTYEQRTFGRERYSVWTIQSGFHNLPEINGKGQCHPFRAAPM